MRKTLGVAALMLALCCPAFAGEIHTTGAPTPPPPAQASNQQGDIQVPTADTTTEDGTQGTYMQIALELLTLLPSIL